MINLFQIRTQLTLKFIFNLLITLMSSSFKISQDSMNAVSNPLQISLSDCPDLAFRSLSNHFTRSKHFLSKNTKKYRITPLASNQNTIKPKMFTKLANWMQKICFSLLNFSEQTFQISLKILKNYLQLSLESSSALQMLGCVSLHLASKINQKIIVSIESYQQCCLNIFTKDEFVKKQAQVYQKLEGLISEISLFETFDLICCKISENISLDSEREAKIRQTLKVCCKDLAILQAEPYNVVLNIFVEILCNPEAELNSEKIIQLIQKRSSY